MNDPITKFQGEAKNLARNPLGIIALFIVLVYGMASLVMVSTESDTVNERQTLIFFLVFFPVLVLAAFTWLVSKHSDKLYGPGDFTDQENYLKLVIATSLGAAAGKTSGKEMDANITEIVDSVQFAATARPKKCV